jgi:membrane associated rhomboid family serine protease
MIPLKDNAPRYSFPVITLTLIAINVLVFLYQVTLSNYALDNLVYQNGVVPLRVTGFMNGRVPLDTALAPFFTCMFLHGGWLHLIGNMWFLWIFGDNIEDYLGHFSYLLFYLGCGFAAAITHILLNAGSRMPSVGASGAIAGVMGAYFVLYPKARVMMWFPPIFFFHLPAWLVLGYWFFMQFLSGAATSIAETSQTNGGIAFWAHVGGFVAGVVLIKVLPARPRRYRYAAW